MTRGQFVERQAQTVDVAAFVALSVEPLRSQVSQRTGQVAVLGDLRRVRRAGQPEISDPHDPLVVQQEVRRLYVPVQRALIVCVGDCRGGLVAGVGHEPPVRIRARLAGARDNRAQQFIARSVIMVLQTIENLVQPDAANVLHYVVVESVVLPYSVDLDDIGMVQA